MSLNFLSCNIHSVLTKGNRFDLDNIIRQNSISFVMLCETWLKSTDHFKLKHFVTYRNDRGVNPGGAVRNGGGLLTSIHSSFASKMIDNLTYRSNVITDIEILVVQLELGPSDKIYLINFYKHPLYRGNFGPLENVLRSLYGEKIILGGDINSRHPAWGYTHPTNEGRLLMDIFNDNDLVLANNQHLVPTRRASKNCRPGVNDLILVKQSIIQKVSFQVQQIAVGSDHYPLTFQLQTYNPLHKKNTLTQDHKPRPIHIRKFTRVVKKKFEAVQDQTTISYEKWEHIILESLEEARSPGPPKKPAPVHQTSKFVPWWNVKCQSAKNIRDIAFQQWKADNSWESLAIYHEKAAKFKLVVKEEQRKSWHSICFSLTINTPRTSVWTRLKTLQHCKEPTKTKDTSWCQAYSENLTPDSVPNTRPPEEPPNPNLGSPLTFSYDEFLQSFYNIKNKCPGKDKITKKILNALPQVAIKCLYNAYIQILSTENIPKSWNEVIIKPILKPMKPENHPTSYRPISLF
ncbi:unnamed protein product [Bemisia tabaci]|uniref:Endonuclease/exonuclease/phosphatase domain-containing protein n=1 Tax=Bemisia tabaci TaxID=7038 RepID=A0AAI8Y610_BEMTA|nr:unnamed protein product [Bemisia tabaci]